MKFAIFQGPGTGETPKIDSSDAIAFPNIQRLNIKATDQEAGLLSDRQKEL
jgi:hypothetical protein